MSNKYFPDIIIPSGFPESIKRRLAEKNRILQEKRDLIDQEPNYDEFTKKIISDYIKSFQTLYGGILTDEELYTRIKANLKYPIEIVHGLKDERGPHRGAFNIPEHKILLDDKYIDNGILTPIGKTTIFHELTHTLVAENPFDIEEHDYHDNSNFIVESIVTIMEEEYARKILNLNENRINGYIPTYANEIYSIFGKDLIKEYIIKFRNINGLFDEISKGDLSYSYDILSSLSDEIDDIYYSIIKDSNKEQIAYKNKNIELGITTVLDHYLASYILTDEEKLNKIISLVKKQISPDFEVIRGLIRKYIKDKSIIERNEYARNIYYGVQKHDKNEKIGKEIIELQKKIKDYEACGLFGANEIETKESRFGLPKYSYEAYTHYQYNKKLYDALYELLQDNKLQTKDLSFTKLEKNREMSKDELEDIRDQLASGLNPGILRLARALRFDENIYKCTTKDSSFYIKSSLGNELLRKDSLLNVINHYKKLINRGIDKEEIDTYKSAIKKLLTLVEEDVEEVYFSDTTFIYEKNGKTYINNSSYKEDENGDDFGYFEEREIKMDQIALPEGIKIASKHIGL